MIDREYTKGVVLQYRRIQERPHDGPSLMIPAAELPRPAPEKIKITVDWDDPDSN